MFDWHQHKKCRDELGSGSLCLAVKMTSSDNKCSCQSGSAIGPPEIHKRLIESLYSTDGDVTPIQDCVPSFG